MKTDTVTKTLAVTGALLVWTPLLLPLAFGLARLGSGRPVLVDWLIPAELFPIALLGAAVLLWAARRARSRLRTIGWGLGIAVLFLVGSQVLAIVTGLASGTTGPTGWPWAVVVGAMAGYILALIVVAVAGLLLVRDTFR